MVPKLHTKDIITITPERLNVIKHSYKLLHHEPQYQDKPRLHPIFQYQVPPYTV